MCIFRFSKKHHLVCFLSLLNYGDIGSVLINHLQIVIPLSYPCHYTNLCPHKPAHTRTHTHTHTHTANLLYSIHLTCMSLDCRGNQSTWMKPTLLQQVHANSTQKGLLAQVLSSPGWHKKDCGWVLLLITVGWRGCGCVVDRSDVHFPKEGLQFTWFAYLKWAKYINSKVLSICKCFKCVSYV